MKRFSVVTGRGDDDIVMAGYDAGGGLIMRFDGTSWNEMPVPTGAGPVLSAWVSPAGDVYFVDSRGLYQQVGVTFGLRAEGNAGGFQFVFGFDDGRVVAISPSEAVVVSPTEVTRMDMTSPQIIVQAHDGTLLGSAPEGLVAWEP